MGTGNTRTAPRFLRLRDAPSYFGMDKNRFNRDVRPCVAAIPIGTQSIAFDHLDLDLDLDEATRFLNRRLEKLRQQLVYGQRQDRTFREEATKYLNEHLHKRSLERDARALQSLDPSIGILPVSRVHQDSLASTFRPSSRRASAPAPSTAIWRWCAGS